MKKTLLFTFLALMGMSHAVAQEYEYVPFVREGVKWVYIYDEHPLQNIQYYSFEMKGDTVFGGKHYKPVVLYLLNDEGEEIKQDFTPVYLREEDKVVYAIHPDGRYYRQCPVGFYEFVNYASTGNISNEEFILYDFNDPNSLYQGMLTSPEGYPSYLSYIGMDTVAIGGHISKRYHYKGLWNNNDDAIIEGIGCDCYYGMPLFYFPYFITGVQDEFGLSHVIENGEIIYKGLYYQEPAPDGYEGVPYLTEGVKFVNERVIVNNGDTTSMYYIYEIAARTDTSYDETEQPSYEEVFCCKYYTPAAPAEGKDNIISRMSREPAYVGPGNFWVFDNEAYWQTEAEGRNMTRMWGLMVPFHLLDKLYDYDRLLTAAIYRYVTVQPEPRELKEENFVEVDPVLIDGKLTQRIAYINDNGEPLAYIVQGIGFDSYDMGDLLTPFTRKPDPTADYQEWCGLSHVVKDGQIIYKGMRYRPDAHVGIDEVATEKPQRPVDPQYYNLMGQPMGKDVPTTPGIYIHQGKKIVVR